MRRGKREPRALDDHSLSENKEKDPRLGWKVFPEQYAHITQKGDKRIERRRKYAC